jgi:hypothetical protein
MMRKLGVLEETRGTEMCWVLKENGTSVGAVVNLYVNKHSMSLFDRERFQCFGG